MIQKRWIEAIPETGAIGIISHPFDRYHRLDVGGGYEARDVSYPFADDAGNLFFIGRRDNFPLVSASFSGDTTTYWQRHGELSGIRRARFLLYRVLLFVSRAFSFAAHRANPNVGLRRPPR